MEAYGAGIGGGASVLAIGIVYKLLQHFKCASKCCGSESSLNIDVGTPPNDTSAAKGTDKNNVII